MEQYKSNRQSGMSILPFKTKRYIGADSCLKEFSPHL